MGSNISQGLEDEPSLGHARVGEGEGFIEKLGGSDVEEVEIDDPGRVSRGGSGAPEVFFNLFQAVQNFQGSKAASDFDDGIEKERRAFGTIDRHGFVDPGAKHWMVGCVKIEQAVIGGGQGPEARLNI